MKELLKLKRLLRNIKNSWKNGDLERPPKSPLILPERNLLWTKLLKKPKLLPPLLLPTTKKQLLLLPRKLLFLKRPPNLNKPLFNNPKRNEYDLIINSYN
jgi:hypothetical protein